MSLDGSDASPGSDVTTGPSMLQQCREVQCFEKLNGINEGTYGMVYRYGLHLKPYGINEGTYGMVYGYGLHLKPCVDLTVTPCCRTDLLCYLQECTSWHTAKLPVGCKPNLTCLQVCRASGRRAVDCISEAWVVVLLGAWCTRVICMPSILWQLQC